MVRLLFTLLQHTSTPSKANGELLQFARKVLAEEKEARPYLFSIGVRSVAQVVRMPPNVFEVVDKAAMDYDDRRVCCVCKCVCVFSAVACECNNSRVACTRHEQYMCKCPKYGTVIQIDNIYLVKPQPLQQSHLFVTPQVEEVSVGVGVAGGA